MSIKDINIKVRVEELANSLELGEKTSHKLGDIDSPLMATPTTILTVVAYAFTSVTWTTLGGIGGSRKNTLPVENKITNATIDQLVSLHENIRNQ